MAKWTQRDKLMGVLVASIGACAAGVTYAVLWGRAADGVTGGALAVAISFAALFAARDTSAQVLEMKSPDGRSDFEALPVEMRIGLLKAAMASLIDAQRLEKKFLTWSSVIGTLTWGFGDILAAWLGAPLS